jgi:hypothetical protein
VQPLVWSTTIVSRTFNDSERRDSEESIFPGRFT